MKRRIVDYLKQIDELLAKEHIDVDWQKEIEKHLIQISFFQHERLIHLLVTITFAILTFLCLMATYLNSNLYLLILLTLLMVLLIPYIGHYYRLENGVQKMYRQYDEMCRRKRQCVYQDVQAGI